jgi:hypothetical protein
MTKMNERLNAALKELLLKLDEFQTKHHDTDSVIIEKLIPKIRTHLEKNLIPFKSSEVQDLTIIWQAADELKIRMDELYEFYNHYGLLMRSVGMFY